MPSTPPVITVWRRSTYVEPAAAALAPRHGAEFIAARAPGLAGIVFRLGGERAFNHLGGVGF